MMSSHAVMGSSQETNTLLSHIGRASSKNAGFVNMPVYRGSTILAETLEEWNEAKTNDNPMANYGRFGSPLTKALETSMCTLESGVGAVVFPSGLSACTHAFIGLVSAGDHVLLSDSVYGPSRQFAMNVLRRMGIEVDFFSPTSLSDLTEKIRPKTRVVYVESPGSMTFEVQDVRAISSIAHANNAYVVMDNTWATPLFFRPLEHGVDISIQAATKYIIGHSDALLGIATANERAWPHLRAAAHSFGETAGPDDIFLALRGLRTLSIRMQQHWRSGVALADWLSRHEAVSRVLNPALPSDPGHELWKRDFTGASGLFGVVLKPMSPVQLSVLFKTFTLFGIGLSWGGYESLALLVDPLPTRQGGAAVVDGHLLRIHAGLENVDDLINDFSNALSAALKAR